MKIYESGEGVVWCARETREQHVTIGRTVSKREATKNLPAFQDLSDNQIHQLRTKLTKTYL